MFSLDFANRKKFIALGFLVVAVFFTIVTTNYVLHKVLHFLFILFLSFLLSCALEVPVGYVSKIGIHRKIATGIVMFSFVVFLITLGFGAYKAIGSEVSSFANNFGTYINDFVGKINSFNLIKSDFNADNLVASLNKEVSHFMSSHIASGFTAVFDIATIIFFTYYLVSEGYLFRQVVCRLLPEKYQNFVLDAWQKSIEKSGAYIIARIFLALLSSAVFIIVAFALGLPYAFILGFWYGFISQAIPVIGTYAGGALILIVAANRGTEMIIAVLIAILLFQLVADYIILPKISKYSLNIHPALMMLSVIVGTVLFGPVGALIGIPVVAIISSIFTSYNFLVNEVVSHELLDEPTINQKAPLMKIKNLSKNRNQVKNSKPTKNKVSSKPTKNKVSKVSEGSKRATKSSTPVNVKTNTKTKGKVSSTKVTRKTKTEPKE